MGQDLPVSTSHTSFYHRILMFPNLVYLRFLTVSIALHGLLLLMARSHHLRQEAVPVQIPVSILERSEPTPNPEPVIKGPNSTKANRTPRGSAKVAPKDIVRAPNRALTAPQWVKPDFSHRAEPAPAPPASTPPREVLPEQTIVVERPLPSIRELLPPANWSSRSPNSGPVNLNTSDPVYVSYFTKIKQLIEANWQYPELALRYGLQGKLSLEFTIGSLGQLERARIVRSSGSQLLDDEALRAIKAAAPFPPIPSWIKPNPLPIVAAMEYHDNRVNYQFVR